MPDAATSDELIVGAGPTGLALACVLAARGTSFRLVDRLTAGADTSRAAHARTLEVLEEVQVRRTPVRRGLRVPRAVLRDRERALVTVRFDSLPTRYPYG